MTPSSLSAEAVALSHDFELFQGELRMPDAKLAKWASAHAALNLAQRKTRRIELIAIAVRFQQLGPGAKEAVSQLASMVAALVVAEQTSPAQRTSRW